jgi:hypothetical protein
MTATEITAKKKIPDIRDTINIAVEYEISCPKTENIDSSNVTKLENIIGKNFL